MSYPLFELLVGPLIDLLIRRSARQWQSDEVIAEEDRPKKRLLELRPRLDAEMRQLKAADPSTLSEMLANAPPVESMVGEPWSSSEERMLTEAYYMGATLNELALLTGRRLGGISARLQHLHVVRKGQFGTLLDVKTGREVRR